MWTRCERQWRWVLPVALCVASLPLVAGCGGDDGAVAGTTPSTVAAPRSLTADFESGGTGDWTETARATVTAAAAHAGRGGLDVAAHGSDAYARWVAPPHLPYWSFRSWVRVVSSTPGESVDLFTVRNREMTNNFDLFVGAGDRAFQWDLFRENAARAAGAAEPGRWYLVEVRGSFADTTSTAEVRIDGLPQPAISSPGQPRSAVREFLVGSIGTEKTNRVQFDDVRIDVGDAPIAFLGPAGSSS